MTAEPQQTGRHRGSAQAAGSAADAPGQPELPSLALEHPFTLAALSGYSDMGMRTVCRRLGASVTRNEVVLDEFIANGGRGGRSGRHLHPDDHPVACQLMGNDADRMGRAAATMVGYGYDLVDINFGCPVKSALGRCRGGFLLGEPDEAIAILEAVTAAVDVPVTVKMRRGADDTPESQVRFDRIADAAVELGVAGIAVHGRTVEQRYRGLADWSAIGRLKVRHPRLTVFGSGDLYTAADCLRMLLETGCDGVTIARGAIENPWIFRDCLALWHGRPLPGPPTVAEQRELLTAQHELCVAQYGARKAGRQMRKFGIKRALQHPDGEAVRRAFIELSTPEQWQDLVDRFYPVAEQDAIPSGPA